MHLLTYLYLHTYIPTYIPTYLHTYTHSFSRYELDGPVQLLENRRSGPIEATNIHHLATKQISQSTLLDLPLVSRLKPRTSLLAPPKKTKVTRNQSKYINYIDVNQQSPLKKQLRQESNTFILFGDETQLGRVDERFCVCAERATYVRKGKGQEAPQVRNFFEGGFTCLTNEGGRYKKQDRVSIICVLFWKAFKGFPGWLKKVIPYPLRKGVKLVVKCENGSVKIISRQSG